MVKNKSVTINEFHVDLFLELFSMYMLPVGHIVEKHRVSYHYNADGTQLYPSFVITSTNQLNNLYTLHRFQ